MSDAIEHAAIANATLPLYIGLMGTFIGVIIGLLSFVGGASLSGEPDAFTDPGHLRHFVGGVLIAMIGSFCGLLLSVIGRSIFLHHAQAGNDRKKQSYFSLLQTQLLPVVGQDVSSALYSLQDNLRKFNVDFSSNLTSFKGVMGVATQTLTQQRQLIEMLNSTNIRRIIEANADMLRKSESISESLLGFVQSTNDLRNRLDSTGQLIDKFNALLDRFGKFEHSVNSLGEKIALDQSVVVSTVQLIREQIVSLRSGTDVIREFVTTEDTDIRRYIEAQRQKLHDLIDASRQQLDDLSQQISRSIADIFGGVNSSLLVDGVTRLKVIDEQLQRVNTTVGQMQQSNDERDVRMFKALKGLPNEFGPELAKHLARLQSIDDHMRQIAIGMSSQPKRSSQALSTANARANREQDSDGVTAKRGWFRRRLPRWLGGRGTRMEKQL